MSDNNKNFSEDELRRDKEVEVVEEEIVEIDADDDYDGDLSKEERKAQAKEEYKRKMMLHEQQVLAKRKKEEERETKNEQLVKEGKRPVKEGGVFSSIGRWFVRVGKKIGKGFKDVFGEVKHVSWAKPDKVFRSTVVVLAVTGVFLVVAIGMDSLLGLLYEWFMGKM